MLFRSVLQPTVGVAAVTLGADRGVNLCLYHPKLRVFHRNTLSYAHVKLSSRQPLKTIESLHRYFLLSKFIGTVEYAGRRGMDSSYYSGPSARPRRVSANFVLGAPAYCGAAAARESRLEVTEPIGKLALPIHIAIVGFRELASIKTVAHHYGIGRLAYSFEEQR